MNKRRIVLGSSGKHVKLLQAPTRGMEDVAHVEPWTAVFNPGLPRELRCRGGRLELADLGR